MLLVLQQSLAEFSKIYDRLGVTIVERGESFYQPMMAAVVKELEEKSECGGAGKGQSSGSEEGGAKKKGDKLGRMCVCV